MLSLKSIAILRAIVNWAGSPAGGTSTARNGPVSAWFRRFFQKKKVTRLFGYADENSHYTATNSPLIQSRAETRTTCAHSERPGKEFRQVPDHRQSGS